MLATMANGDPFTITTIGFDKRRPQKSGRLHTFEGILCQQDEEEKKVEGRSQTPMEQAITELETLKKNPNHHDHYTRNLELCVNGYPTGERRKFHPPLVWQFNGKTVVP